MTVGPVSGNGALAFFSQTLQQLKAQVQAAPPRQPEPPSPPPSPVSDAAKDVGGLLDVKL